MSNKSNKSKPSYLYASMSVAIVLFLLGLFFVLFLHSANMGTLLKEKVNVVVELEDTADRSAISNVLSAQTAVKEGSVQYISKADGLEFMTDGNSIDFAGENPLQDLLLFNVKAEQYSDESLAAIKTLLEKQPGVSMVYYENMILENIKHNIRRLSTLILILGLVFIFLAIVIIRNTINLSMYADRSEILTLQRVGAKPSFVKMPYIKSSVMVGVRGWVIAVLFLAAVVAAVLTNFPSVWSSLRLVYIAISLLGLLAVAIIIPAVVANAAANSYLKQ